MLLTRGLRSPKGARRSRSGRVEKTLEALEGRALLTSAAFALTADWGSGFGGQISITNTQATPVTNWRLAFDWDRSITDIWDATIVSHLGNHYVIQNGGWNGTI